MDGLKRHPEFNIDNPQELENKILTYFNYPGFQLVEKTENFFRFKNNSFFFSTWTFNPLKWKSEITVKIHRNKIEADFFLDLSAQLNVSKKVEVWDTFIKNFQLFLTENIDYQTSNENAVMKAKKSGWKTIGWVLLTALGTGMLAIFVRNLTGLDLSSYLLVPIGVVIFLRIKGNREKMKNAL
jgi:hypothetical protein